MPDETHNYLINYETAGADRVVADNERIAESQRRLIEAQERLTTIGRMDISGLPISGRSIAEQAEAMRRQQEWWAEQRATTAEPYQLDISEFNIMSKAEALRAAGPPSGKGRLAERLEDIGADAAFTTDAFRRYNEAVVAHIPTEMAVSQAIRETAASFRTLQEELEPTVNWSERMTSQLQDMGANQAFSAQATEKYNALVAEGIPAQTAMSQAIRETNRAIQDTGEAAQKSGRWLSGYIQRYLIRYFVVWQGMVALKTGIRDWIQSHEDMALAIYRVQGAMSATTSEAQRYMGVLAGVGAGIGVPAGQMVGAAMQTTPQLAGQMAQWGQVTGAGPQQAMAMFTQIQRDYNLTAQETEMIMARLFAVWDKLGIPIQDVTQNWGEWLGKIGEGPALIDYMNDRFQEFTDRGLDSTDKLSTAWRRYLGVLGDTAPITAAKQALTELFNLRAGGIEEWQETGPAETIAGLAPTAFGVATQITELVFGQERTEAAIQAVRDYFGGPETTAAGPELLPGAGREAAMRGMGWRPFQVQGAPMQETEFARLQAGAEKWDAFFEANKIGVEVQKQEFAVLTQMGVDIRELEASNEAIQWATEEMNERQKTAVYNWPGNVQGVMIGLQSLATAQIQPRADEPTPWTFNPQPIDWSNPWSDPWRGYQHGGEVRETGPAIVHKGEQIIPVGGVMSGNLNLQSNLYLDGRLVANNTSRIMGDQLLQAQRASQGSVGALVS